MNINTNKLITKAMTQEARRQAQREVSYLLRGLALKVAKDYMKKHKEELVGALKEAVEEQVYSMLDEAAYEIAKDRLFF